MSKDVKPSGVGLSFGFVFLLVGLGVAYFTAGSALLGQRITAHWESVPAELISWSLQVRRDNSTTYSVRGSYRYEYGGESYTSDAISFYSGNDNIGDYWQQLFNRVKADNQRGDLQVWVNPDNPRQAILDRTIRTGMLIFGGVFLLGFGGVGALVLYLAWSSRYATADQHLVETAAPQSPAEPVISVSAASEQGIASNERNHHSVAMWIGGAILVLPAPALLKLPDLIAAGHYAALLFLLFPLIGLFFLDISWDVRKKFLQIGQTPLFPDPYPGHTGGRIGGYFDLSACRFAGRPQARLSCVHTYQVATGSHNVRHDLVWEQKQPASLQGQRVSMEFDVPAQLPASGPYPGHQGSIYWKLACEGEVMISGRKRDGMQRIPFSRSWRVPVITGPAQDSTMP